jgi:hypothetical protein
MASVRSPDRRRAGSPGRTGTALRQVPRSGPRGAPTSGADASGSAGVCIARARRKHAASECPVDKLSWWDLTEKAAFSSHPRSSFAASAAILGHPHPLGIIHKLTHFCLTVGHWLTIGHGWQKSPRPLSTASSALPGCCRLTAISRRARGRLSTRSRGPSGRVPLTRGDDEP